MKILQNQMQQMLFSCLLIAVYLFTSFPILAKNEVIKVVTENNYPVNYIDKNDKKLKGYTADLIRTIGGFLSC